MLCVNPEDEPESQTWLDGNDPGPLLSVLTNFAEHGTFAQVGDIYDSIRLLPLRHAYRLGRQAGKTHESVVQDLAIVFRLSTRTIERKVRTDKP
jgi:hypothetical protein